MGKQDSIYQTMKTFAHDEVHLHPHPQAHTSGSANTSTHGETRAGVTERSDLNLAQSTGMRSQVSGTQTLERVF